VGGWPDFNFHGTGSSLKIFWMTVPLVSTPASASQVMGEML
jgi:hypothetical protein